METRGEAKRLLGEVAAGRDPASERNSPERSGGGQAALSISRPFHAVGAKIFVPPKTPAKEVNDVQSIHPVRIPGRLLAWYGHGGFGGDWRVRQYVHYGPLQWAKTYRPTAL
jgi:hypothetical protein